MILKDNINKVLERGERLDDLIGKTDDLQATVRPTRSAVLFLKTNTNIQNILVIFIFENLSRTLMFLIGWEFIRLMAKYAQQSLLRHNNVLFL